MRLIAILSVLLVFGMSGCKLTKRGTSTSPGQTAERPWERKRPIRQPQPPPPVDPTVGTWEKLLETDLYELYAKNYEKGWCYEGYLAWLKQVYNVGADYVFVNDDTYTKRFEQEILPILKARCSQLSKIKIYNYIKGVRIDYPSLTESPEVQEIPGGDRRVADLQDKDGSLNQTEVRINSWGNQYFMYGYESLLDLRTPRSEREGLNQNYAHSAKEWDKWEKREDEANRRQRATEEAAEQKLTAMNRTPDGQLNLSGIDNDHKRLFLMIYNGDFLDLSQREDIQDLPILMYRGMIIRNDKLCHDFLSRNAVTVEETWDRLDHIDRNFLAGIVTEHYVKEKLIITMEPQYRDAFKFASNKSFKDNVLDKLLSVLTDPDLKTNRRRNPIESGAAQAKPFRDAMKELEGKIEKVKTALTKLLPRESCGKPGRARFMDNLTRYVTSDYSKERPLLADGTYPYKEKIGRGSGPQIERFYENVPPTFSPDFPVPEDNELIWIWISKDSGRQGLRHVSTKKFDLSHLTADGSYSSIMLPAYVRQALQESKYFVAECGYLDGGAGPLRYYWNANGPLPPESIRVFAKKRVSEPRTSCPVNLPSRN